MCSPARWACCGTQAYGSRRPTGRFHEERRMIRRAYADLPHGQVHYAECGARDAPPVLLLHQTPRSWMEYRHVLPLLGARYRAIAMDTAGFGASDPPAGAAAIEAWAAVAAQLLDVL